MTRKRELILGCSFILAATVLTLALGEIALRLITARKLIYNIEMVKYAKALKMRDPRGLVSHVHRPDSSAQLMGVKIALNSLGNRASELATPKPSGTERILVLGSSITMGWGVPAESVFTAISERRLNTEKPFGPGVHFEIQNAGIGNYNTVFQHQLFLDQFPRVRPDLVLLHYFISDVQPRSMGRDSALLKHSLLAAFSYDRFGQLQFRQQKTDLFTFYNRLYADDSDAWKITREHIAAMRDTCQAAGVPFEIQIIPDIHDLAPDSPFAALYAKMETTFTALGIPTSNTFPAFQKSFGDDVTALWIQADDPHPNAAGHALMADLFVTHLIHENPLHLPAPKN